MRNHVYEFDEIVIGSSLNALTYSYFNSKPIIFCELKKPQFFEFFDFNFDLSKLSVEQYEFKLRSPTLTKMVGTSKLEVWERLSFILSLSGLTPVSNNAASIRIYSDDNIIKLFTKNSRMVKFKFDKIRIFDDTNVAGLGLPIKQQKNYRVIDWVDVKSGMSHPFTYIQGNDTFVNEIFFYPSKRFDGSRNRKDAVSISYLNEEQINNFDYSDTYVKFKTLSMMKDAGIKGARNGKDASNPDKYKYYALKIETSWREIQKIKMDSYKNTSNLFFDYRTEEEVYNSYKPPRNYLSKLNEMIVEDGK